MDENFTLGLSKWSIIFLVVLCVVEIILLFSRRVDAFLKSVNLSGDTLAIFIMADLFAIGCEFTRWWIAGLIAFIITAIMGYIAVKYRKAH